MRPLWRHRLSRRSRPFSTVCGPCIGRTSNMTTKSKRSLRARSLGSTSAESLDIERREHRRNLSSNRCSNRCSNLSSNRVNPSFHRNRAIPKRSKLRSKIRDKMPNEIIQKTKKHSQCDSRRCADHLQHRYPILSDLWYNSSIHKVNKVMKPKGIPDCNSQNVMARIRGDIKEKDELICTLQSQIKDVCTPMDVYENSYRIHRINQIERQQEAHEDIPDKPDEDPPDSIQETQLSDERQPVLSLTSKEALKEASANQLKRALNELKLRMKQKDDMIHLLRRRLQECLRCNVDDVHHDQVQAVHPQKEEECSESVSSKVGAMTHCEEERGFETDTLQDELTKVHQLLQGALEKSKYAATSIPSQCTRMPEWTPPEFNCPDLPLRGPYRDVIHHIQRSDGNCNPSIIALQTPLPPQRRRVDVDNRQIQDISCRDFQRMQMEKDQVHCELSRLNRGLDQMLTAINSTNGCATDATTGLHHTHLQVLNQINASGLRALYPDKSEPFVRTMLSTKSCEPQNPKQQQLRFNCRPVQADTTTNSQIRHEALSYYDQVLKEIHT